MTWCHPDIPMHLHVAVSISHLNMVKSPPAAHVQPSAVLFVLQGEKPAGESCQNSSSLSDRVGRKENCCSFSDIVLPKQGHPIGCIHFPERLVANLALMADAVYSLLPTFKQWYHVRMLAAAKTQHRKIMYCMLDKHFLSNYTKTGTINRVSKCTWQSSDRLQATSIVSSCTQSQCTQITLWFGILV